MSEDNSLNNHPEQDEPTHVIRGFITDAEAARTGVKWQHGPGHSPEHGVYLFWGKTLRDFFAVGELEVLARNRAKAARAAQRKRKRR